MGKNRQISRRTVLRGIGTAIALPWLESIMPRLSLAAPGGLPRRMAFFSVPNGVHMPDWTPKREGPLDVLPPILASLEPLKSSVAVLTGLALDGGRPHRDGPGDHARSAASFLTGAHPYKTAGKDIRNGVSVEQAAAERVGRLTRFASLELGCERSGQAGNCDSGYSCAYSSNISWRTPTSPMSKEVNPRAVFDRLFGPAELTAEDRARHARQERRRKSILDFAAEDAAELRRKLDPSDGRKLDEYLYAVRDVERRLQKAETAAASLPAGGPPAGTPKEFAEHVRLMMDMIVLAFQTDSTRIVTFMYLNEGNNRSYPEIGVRAGHHELSHHGRNPEKQAQISKINRYHLGLLAEFLQKLDAAKEGDGTLLHSAMIVYGSGLSDGDRHNHDDLPILLAGRGGGTILGGRHLRYPKETPLTNLYLAMLDRMGAVMPKFSDSTGELEL
jgi:hypothetical protein